MSKIVFLVGTRWFGVLGPCKKLIETLVEDGFKVYVFGQSDNHYMQFSNASKVTLIRLNIARSYFSFLKDIVDIVKIALFALKHKPLAIHTFNPKPALLTNFAIALVWPKPKFFIGITGLGNTFIRARTLRKLIEFVFKKANSNADYVFFQNEDDKNLFENKLDLNKDKSLIFKSPGVDLDRFERTDLEIERRALMPNSKIRVILVARLIWQKGVRDFLSVWESLIVTKRDHMYCFTLVGEKDFEHPDRLEDNDIEVIQNSGINHISWTDNVEDVYRNQDVLLFMSLREGGPRTVLEASASGLPTIGANTVGVKDLIKNGITGYTVEPGDLDTILVRLEEYRLAREILLRHGLAAKHEIAKPLSLSAATSAQLQMYISSGLIDAKSLALVNRVF